MPHSEIWILPMYYFSTYLFYLDKILDFFDSTTTYVHKNKPTDVQNVMTTFGPGWQMMDSFGLWST